MKLLRALRDLLRALSRLLHVLPRVAARICASGARR